MNESIIESRRRQTADRLGIETNKVQAIRLELQALRENGLLIDIDIHGISMFTSSVTYNELGIPAEDVRTKRLRTGKKDLFPDHSKKLRSLEARARQNLDAHSHRVQSFGNWRWLPWTAYDSFMEKHREILAELDSVKRDAINRWHDIQEANRRYFAQVAERAWRAMTSSYGPGDEIVIVTVDGAHFERHEKDRFVEYVVQRSLAKMPRPTEIEREVQIDYRTSILYGESELAADEAALMQARAEEKQARLAAVQAADEIWEAGSNRRLKEAQEQARVTAIKANEMEHARQQLLRMGSPLLEALDSLQANVYDAVNTLLTGLRKNGGFRGRASAKATELYDYWRRLNGNLLQDDQLDRALEELNDRMQAYQQASGDGQRAQVGDIEVKLSEIAALTNEAARKARNTQSRAAALEL